MSTQIRMILNAALLIIIFEISLAYGYLQPNFHDELNATYDFSQHVDTMSLETKFVNFSGIYPARYDSDLTLQGDTIISGSGDTLDITAFRIKSHTSNAINLKTKSDIEYGFVELKFPDNFDPIHPTDIVLLMEAFNFYDCTVLPQDKKDIIVDIFFKDPFTNEEQTFTKKLPIDTYVRHFKSLTLGSCYAIIAVPINAYPLEENEPFMDLQTFRLTEEQLKFRVQKIKISVPRIKTLIYIPGLPTPITVNGGIRLHGVALTTDFAFGREVMGDTTHFDLDGPWFGQVHCDDCTPWRFQLVNPNNPNPTYTFRAKGCWISAWCNLLHAQGVTEVEDEMTSNMVPLTPLNFARYAKKKELFKFNNEGIELSAHSIKIILSYLKDVGNNTTLEYLDLGSDPETAPDWVDTYLARKIPVFLGILQDDHCVVATGIKVKKYNGDWIRTYRINDVGYVRTLDLADEDAEYSNWENIYKFPLFAAPSDKSSPEGRVIEIYSQAYAYIIDPLGRRHGLNPDNGIEYKEIPFLLSTIGDPSNTTHPDFEEPPDPDPVKYIFISRPVEGDYVIKVVGTDIDYYLMEITDIDTEGVSVTTTVEGNTSPGQVDEFVYEYTSYIEDVTPPVTVADYVDTGWNKIYPLVIHFTSTDDISGVAQTYVSVNGAPEQPVNVITLTKEGEIMVEYWSVDNKGNVEETKTLIVLNDFTPPVSSHDYCGDGTEIGSETIIFEVSDQLSGVYSSILLVNGVEYSFGILELIEPGNYDIQYYSIDEAGNVETSKSLIISIIEEGPPIEHLKAIQIHRNDVLLHWRKLKNYVTYKVLSSPDGTKCSFVEVGQTKHHKYVDEGLEIGQKYFYRVESYNSRSGVVDIIIQQRGKSN